jgi:hypothetical protein
MKAQTQTEFLPIIPIDDDTRAMLAYAASPKGRVPIEHARRELQEGKGIIVTPGHFDTWILDHFLPLRDPAGGARHRE